MLIGMKMIIRSVTMIGPVYPQVPPMMQVLDGYLPMVEPHLDVLIERSRKAGVSGDFPKSWGIPKSP